jgi:hypothetical protein
MTARSGPLYAKAPSLGQPRVFATARAGVPREHIHLDIASGAKCSRALLTEGDLTVVGDPS